MIALLFFIVNLALSFSQEIVTTYPTLPTIWVAETIEPGAPGSGKGVESYSFMDKPTYDHPSAMWSNYTDCQRLIYVPNNYDAKRYLLGCESINCCWEPQDGNQVEFQIPNVRYSNPNKKVDVYWRNVNITNFGKTFEADEWSWSWTVKDVLSQDWRAYTLPCEECVNGIQLVQWQSRAMGLEWWPIEFKNYKGYDASTEEGANFMQNFAIPDICQKNNLLQCPSGLHSKYFNTFIASNDEYKPVDSVDLSMYSGRWYQVYKDAFDMTFQGQGKCAVADYTMTTTNISVLNSQFNKYDKVEQISGYAFYQNGNTGGELSVSLDGVPTPMPYWIIELGPIINDQYQYSIISDDNKVSLFVLTRDVDEFYKNYDSQVSETLTKLGFTKYINKPTVMSQDDCDYTQFNKNINDQYEGADCGTCGTAYQTCCIGFAIDGYPCDCHLQEGGSGTAGSNCGDCGTGFSACCIGYAADGYPCQCDVM